MCKSKPDGMIMISVVLLLVVVVWWAHSYFSQLLDNMKDVRARVVNMKEEAPGTDLKACMDKKASDNSVAVCEAYEALDRELTSWLTVLALAGGMFGLLIPLISYLLQHHNLKEDREFLREDIKERMELYNANFSKQLDEMNKGFEKLKSDADKVKEGIDTKAYHVNERMGECEAFVIMGEEFILTNGIRQVTQQCPVKTVDPVDVANIIIGFDFLLETLVRWNKDVAVVRKKMHDWIMNIDAMWHKLKTEQREETVKLLSDNFVRSGEFATRDDFLRILRADSTDFKWLEEFFAPFAPWKFS